MRRRQSYGWNVWSKRVRSLRILVLCALPLLGGCIPGTESGSNGSSDRSAFSGESKDAPDLNRSYKTNFMSIQKPPYGSPAVEGQWIPESGHSFFTTATVESRQTVQTGIPSGLAGPGLEALAPPAQALLAFYAALTALNTGKRSQAVSIVHLGGDQIAGDKFAGALREHLISRFGNAGRGLMPPGLYSVRGMKVDRGGEWSLASAAGQAAGPFGITGARVTSASRDAWLRFTSAEGAFDWIEVTFMTGPRQGTAAVSTDGDVKLVPTNSSSTAQTFIRITARAREIMIRPKGDGEITLLSVSSGVHAPGITYTNAGLPGATAPSIGKWNTDFAANDFRKLSPDLIVFQYGTREGFIDDLDMKGYEASLRLVIDQIRTWAPQASLLIIGPPDAARLPAFAGTAGSQACRSLNPHEIASYNAILDRHDERLARWHAPPRLEAVRSVLRRVAGSSGAFYWDWAKYMGGPCSIHAWTALKPPLAAADHVTLTEAGDERSARALFAELMAGFETYQRELAKSQLAAASTAAPAPPAKASAKKRN